ncbi:hypothetical protein LMG3458_00816 [Achromobacter deleyi]|uniref:DJ-1/PfpI domain-containing protein n=1 Tax=Achromobacter deleyi TaxID=1353891 RepID=A0A6S6Z754_9BURK|nr:DJ-1/PfpI family protein [Achromobacter deleyi]CAB3665465.1 hypothetical protein LMG3458_00816 [Achromobacter deleyi]CAB3834166.1 hypothetical protein LMG3482_00918 [Achromobacter deleyi]CAB3854710.1 hypothetical protein LMG3481_01943 [Achromobacter deleyi]CAB3881406.1 hypothetical protein LMG3412_03275 [Achromobacter deleyi]
MPSSGSRAAMAVSCAALLSLVLAAVLVQRDPGGVPAPLPPTAQPTPPLPGPRASATPRLPRVAVVAHNANTELTDFVVPYAVLKRSGAAEVWALAVEPGAVQFFPALRALPDADMAAFDARYPGGADYVIVPAVHEDADPRLLAWIGAQAAKGAVVIGICDGVWLLARAGLLDGREAVSHWYSRQALASGFPAVRWRQDRRYVADGQVVTTTGVSASIPVSLALVETLAGRERAEALARQLGESRWDAAHPSRGFRLGPRHLYTAARNAARFWNHETLQAGLAPDVDDLVLALTADAYARSYRTSVTGVAQGREAVRLASGLAYLPDTAATPQALSRPLPVLEAERTAPLLDGILAGIEARYGHASAAFVALQLEYPWAPLP